MVSSDICRPRTVTEPKNRTPETILAAAHMNHDQKRLGFWPPFDLVQNLEIGGRLY
jgi:hypothetical protein